ncbi:hypothetical protein AB205_0055270 [Aquarana catesbeiana]|uniref:Uncharacterized protein n=1 Tax=Aquarana catesbeiana TaxID=8400 RepID=A0A2G9Q6V3_AQUCT|nr:hypothetical protein AB205_0055270 [Aquarana catesbeiana]
MRVTTPAPDVLSSLFPAPFHSAQWGKSTWRSQSRCVLIIATRRRKAWSRKRQDPEGDDIRHQICPLGEMLEMVDILKRADYDGKPRSWRKWSRACTESGTMIERSAQEAVVGPKIKRTRAVQKDPESAAKK